MTLDVTFAETIGLGTTFPPPKSLPSNKETPGTGRVGQTATVAGPELNLTSNKFYGGEHY